MQTPTTTIEISHKHVLRDAWRETSYIARKAPADKNDEDRRDRLSMIEEDGKALDRAFAEAAEMIRRTAAEYVRRYHFHKSPGEPVRVVIELCMPRNYPPGHFMSAEEFAHHYAVMRLVADWMRLTGQGDMLKEYERKAAEDLALLSEALDRRERPRPPRRFRTESTPHKETNDHAGEN